MEACNNKGFLSLVSLVKMFKKIEFSMGLVFMWIYYYYLFFWGGGGGARGGTGPGPRA